jgi:hypothetical protein
LHGPNLKPQNNTKKKKKKKKRKKKKKDKHKVSARFWLTHVILAIGRLPSRLAWAKS